MDMAGLKNDSSGTQEEESRGFQDLNLIYWDG